MIDLRPYRCAGKLAGPRLLTPLARDDAFLAEFWACRWSSDAVREHALLPLWALHYPSYVEGWPLRLLQRIITHLLPDALHIATFTCPPSYEQRLCVAAAMCRLEPGLDTLLHVSEAVREVLYGTRPTELKAVELVRSVADRLLRMWDERNDLAVLMQSATAIIDCADAVGQVRSAGQRDRMLERGIVLFIAAVEDLP